MTSKILGNLRSMDKRTSMYAKSSLIMLICQVGGMAISFVMVPLVLGYLGVDNYGIWLTLWGLIEWCNVFDVGLGHGLRNKYAQAKATGDMESAKRYVSTAFFVLLAIGATLFVGFFISSMFVDWSSILNAPESLKVDLRSLVLFIGGFFCVKFVSNIINVLLVADQTPAISSLITFVGNLLSLAGVAVLVLFASPSILLLGICVTGLQLLPLLISTLFLFSGRYKAVVPRFVYFSKPHIHGIFSLGIQFFVIQVTAMFLFAFNNIIISQTCGNADVTEFNIAYKYMNILYVVFMTITLPLWSASTEAYTRGDIDWIKTTFSRVNKIWILMSFGGVLMVGVAPFVYQLWIKDQVEPNYLLLSLMLIYMSLWMRYTLYRTFMNGVGKIRMQLYITSIESIFHIPLALLLAHYYGIYGVLTTMLIWSAINSIWEPIQFKRLTTNKATGLWNK